MPHILPHISPIPHILHQNGPHILRKISAINRYPYNVSTWMQNRSRSGQRSRTAATWRRSNVGLCQQSYSVDKFRKSLKPASINRNVDSGRPPTVCVVMNIGVRAEMIYSQEYQPSRHKSQNYLTANGASYPSDECIAKLDLESCVIYRVYRIFVPPCTSSAKRHLNIMGQQTLLP